MGSIFTLRTITDAIKKLAQIGLLRRMHNSKTNRWSFQLLTTTMIRKTKIVRPRRQPTARPRYTPSPAPDSLMNNTSIGIIKLKKGEMIRPPREMHSFVKLATGITLTTTDRKLDRDALLSLEHYFKNYRKKTGSGFLGNEDNLTGFAPADALLKLKTKSPPHSPRLGHYPSSNQDGSKTKSQKLLKIDDVLDA